LIEGGDRRLTPAGDRWLACRCLAFGWAGSRCQRLLGAVPGMSPASPTCTASWPGRR